MRRIGLTILVLLLLASHVAAQGDVQVMTNSGLNLRATSNTSGMLLGSVSANTELTVLARSSDGNWGAVIYEEQAGWLSLEHVTVTSGDLNDLPVLEQTFENGDTEINIVVSLETTTGTTLRSSPEDTSEELTLIPQGTVLYPLAFNPDGDWIIVEFEEQLGLLALEDITVINGTLDYLQEQLPIFSEEAVALISRIRQNPIDTPVEQIHELTENFTYEDLTDFLALSTILGEPYRSQMDTEPGPIRYTYTNVDGIDYRNPVFLIRWLGILPVPNESGVTDVFIAGYFADSSFSNGPIICYQGSHEGTFISEYVLFRRSAPRALSVLEIEYYPLIYHNIEERMWLYDDVNERLAQVGLRLVQNGEPYPFQTNIVHLYDSMQSNNQ